jgi:hypothetical protein
MATPGKRWVCRKRQEVGEGWANLMGGDHGGVLIGKGLGGLGRQGVYTSLVYAWWWGAMNGC